MKVHLEMAVKSFLYVYVLFFMWTFMLKTETHNKNKGRTEKKKQMQHIHTQTCTPLTHTRLTALFRDYPGEPVPERWNQSGFFWSKRQWVVVASASPPHFRQITMPAPHHSFYLQAGCLSCRPTNSVQALKAQCTPLNALQYWNNR